jgi:hypothetical protein
MTAIGRAYAQDRQIDDLALLSLRHRPRTRAIQYSKGLSD